MYDVKLVDEGRESSFCCTHYAKQLNSEGCAAVQQGLSAPGITVELESGGLSRKLRLPEDGQHIYIMNGSGQTIEHLRWPLPAARRDEKGSGQGHG